MTIQELNPTHPKIELLDTPFVLVDLDLVDSNVTKLFAYFRDNTNVTVRPHLKTVKAPYFAQMLVEAGAKGVCTAKLSEAEIMAQAGLKDILITTELIGEVKIKRLISLLKAGADLKVVVDSESGARTLNYALQESGITLPVLIEINVGQNRCGVEPEAALPLAKGLSELKHLKLVGVQGYEGHLQHLPDAERERLCIEAMEKLSACVETLRKNGIQIDIVTTGGTGTAAICARFPLITEVQPGSFVFMDEAYKKATNGAYANALTVVSTVISKPRQNRVVVDAGTKSLSTDMGMAAVKQSDSGKTVPLYRPGGDEHGILEVGEGEDIGLAIGDRVEFIPSHIDTTVNLHDLYHCHRGGILQRIVPIAARGKVQ